MGRVDSPKGERGGEITFRPRLGAWPTLPHPGRWRGLSLPLKGGKSFSQPRGLRFSAT